MNHVTYVSVSISSILSTSDLCQNHMHGIGQCFCSEALSSGLTHFMQSSGFSNPGTVLPNSIKLILNIYTQVYWTIGIGIGTCLYPSDYS